MSNAEFQVVNEPTFFPGTGRLPLQHDFSFPPTPHWQSLVVGNGALAWTGSTLRLVNTDTTADRYTNAQIDDYQGRPRRAFLWRPPLTLTVRARFSHPGFAPPTDQDWAAARPGTCPGEFLGGTAGFGFWNDPFLMTGARRLTLPRAIWFFYASPPSNMKLDLRTPGCGWKAATIDALGPTFLLLTPTAPLAVLLMRVPSLYRVLWPMAQRAMRVSEALVGVPMTAWHTYTIAWGCERARFSVDGEVILECPTSPRGPLGLVIWKDNQYMVVTPQGRFRHGYLQMPGQQWLEIEKITLTPTTP